MTIKSPIITPRAVKGWVNHSSVLGSNNYDLTDLYSPDNAQSQSCVLDLASPKYNPHKTTIFDKSGYNNHGTITGATWERLPTGVWVNKFDAVDDNILLTNPAPTNMQLNDNFTLLGWYKFPAINPTTRGALFNSHSAGYAQGWTLEYNFGDGKLLNYIDEVSGWQNVSGAVNDNIWRLVSLTKTGATIEVKLNNVSSFSANISGALTNHTTAREIGRNAGNTYVAQYNALIRLFNRVLSATEISGIFNQERSLFGV